MEWELWNPPRRIKKGIFLSLIKEEIVYYPYSNYNRLACVLRYAVKKTGFNYEYKKCKNGGYMIKIKEK